MTKVNKCKCHDLPYTVHKCGCQYCDRYWKVCPRCHGTDIQNIVTREAYMAALANSTNGPLMAKVTECCGAPLRTRHGQGTSHADEGICSVCHADLCSHCASEWSREDGYGWDGQGIRTFALCSVCHVDREDKRQRREWRNDSGV